jgi:osmotically-inducible protein OsmY
MADDDYAPERDMGAVDDDSAFDPPTDPPIVPLGDDGAEVPEDMDDGDDDDVGQTSRGPITDDEISARVRRLLRSDAATSMLRIHVSTEDGVVTLRGIVQTLDDTDNAAEVASRIDGVIDVLDELEVE